MKVYILLALWVHTSGLDHKTMEHMVVPFKDAAKCIRAEEKAREVIYRDYPNAENVLIKCEEEDVK